MSKQNQCYIYIYLDPRKPGYYKYGEYHFVYEPFYIGKGSNSRAWDHLKENSYNPYFNNKIKKIQRVTGNDPYIIIYRNNMCDGDAYILEEQMINIVGRTNNKTGPLCNLTVGGIGASGGKDNHFYGKHHTDENKQYMSSLKKGVPLSKEHRENITKAQTGTKRTPETRQKQSDAQKNLDPKVRAKITTSHRSPEYTDELRKHIGDSVSYLWKVTSPLGEVRIILNLKRFCDENGLCKTGMLRVANNVTHMYKGWKCEIAQERTMRR